MDNEDSLNSMTEEDDEEEMTHKENNNNNNCEQMSPKDNDDKCDQPIMDEQEPVIDVHQLENDKKAVYKHPLFPLLALLLEKCEIATMTLNTSLSNNNSFNSEIEAFVQHQQRDGKPFLSDNSEVDALMIRAIQVLRIHLLELEKVSELCKDFCQRYIACLRTKMNSENLLRGTSGIGGNNSNNSSTFFDGSSCSSTEGSSDDISLSSPQQSSFPSNTNNAQTVYQMVQTAQGLVAQPIQISGQQQIQISGQQQIQGSTPLSQIGGKPLHISNRNNADTDEDDLSDEASSNYNNKKKQQKRGVLPKQATSIMRSWLFQHIVHPYPTEDEKRAIASQTNLTLLQVNNWFINARRRILQPMLDTANALNNNNNSNNNNNNESQSQNLNQSGAKVGSVPKRLKTTTRNPSLQRHWPESLANAVQIRTDKESQSK